MIQQVLVYKYLGVELDNRLLFKDFKNRILQKARRNMGRVWAMGIREGHLSVKASVNLYEALVRSIIEYSCEIWGEMGPREKGWAEGESLQLEMGRRILHCSSKTTTEAILGDLGFWSLRARRDLKKLLYWFKILSLPEDRLLKQSYRMSKTQCHKKKNWVSTIYKLVLKYYIAKPPTLCRDEKFDIKVKSSSLSGVTKREFGILTVKGITEQPLLLGTNGFGKVF